MTIDRNDEWNFDKLTIEIMTAAQAAQTPPEMIRETRYGLYKEHKKVIAVEPLGDGYVALKFTTFEIRKGDA